MPPTLFLYSLLFSNFFSFIPTHPNPTFLSLLLLPFCYLGFFSTCFLVFLSLFLSQGRESSHLSPLAIQPSPLSAGFLDSPSLFFLDSRTMGDHLALLVDHLLTESTLEAAIGNRKHGQIGANSASMGDLGSNSTPDTTVGEGYSSGKLVECRICQEEDQDSNMEIPCSCCGSLKYAHRECVQRWCNEKGNTMCEICLQQFKPGYTTPPKLFYYGSDLMNFRGSWDISEQDLDDSQIITMVPPGVMESDNHDYPALRTRSTVCCRSVTAIFMVLLVLRHTLPLIIDGADEYSFTLFSLLVLKTAGILVPVFLIVATLTTFHLPRRQRATREMPVSSSEVENT